MSRLLTRWLCLGSALLSFETALAGPPALKALPADPHPLRFVANQRQWEKPVLFAADIPAGRLFLESNRLLVARYDARVADQLHHHKTEKGRIPAHAYAVTFVGANADPAVHGEQPTGEHNNYFLGNDETRWATNVPTYTDVRYQKLYPGTDLRFYSRGEQLEYDFELATGAEAALIQLRYDGQQSLRVVDGALQIETSVGRVTEQKPFAYQVVEGHRVAVPCAYVIGPNHTVSFGFPKGYNHARPLVIDPVLVYSSYVGSTALNWGYTATHDTLGNLYSGSITFALGYPTSTGAYDVSFNGGTGSSLNAGSVSPTDITIIKYNPKSTTAAGSRVYATYLGGSGNEFPHSLVVDRDGNLVILGSTSSTNYPTTTGALRRTNAGATDLVVTKLNPTGTGLAASTYMGGTGIDGQMSVASSNALYRNFGDDFRGDIITDRQNNVYFTSVTRSGNFPTTGGQTFGGGHDAVLVKLNPGLTTLGFSTFLGGSGNDAGYSIQLDSLRNVYVAGGTTSTNFPGTMGGLHATYRTGAADGFVAFFQRSAISEAIVLRQSTYLGTTAYDQAYFVQLDRKGAVYVLGQTNGAYPVTPGTYSNPNSRQFIHKINAALTSSVFSTVIGNGTSPVTGGNPYATNLSPTAFLVDNCGQILLSGWGGASIAGMPTTPDAILRNATNNTTATDPEDALGYCYIMQLSANARRLRYGTYFGTGSTHVDGGTCRFDKQGTIYQTVCIRGQNSPIIPLTANAWTRTMRAGGNSAAFKIDVLRLDAGFTPAANNVAGSRIGCAPLTVSFSRTQPSNNGTTWRFGNGQTSTQANNVSTVYPLPGTYTVRLVAYDSTSCQPSISDSTTVTVLGLPRAAAGPDQNICASSSATLSIASPTAGAIYTWSPATGLNTTTGPSVTATPTVTTTYIVQAVLPGPSGSGISCTGQDTVVVNVTPPITIPTIPAPTVCAGSSTTLTVSSPLPGATYTWSPATGLNTPTGPSVVATPASTTTYTVRGVTAAGCTAQSTVTVTVLPAPSLTIVPVAAICAGTATTLTVANALPGTAYIWSPAAGLNTPTGPSVTASPATTTTYTVQAVTTGGCPAQSTVTVTVTPRPNASIAPVSPLCPGTSVTLATTDAGAGATYAWSPATGLGATTGRSVTATPAATTRYRVLVTSAAGCTARDSVLVTVGAPAFVLVHASPRLPLVGQLVSFRDTFPDIFPLTNRRWDFGDGQMATGLTPTHTYTSPGTYTVRLQATYPNGCEFRGSIVLTVGTGQTPPPLEPAPVFAQPNIITPNGDGANDTFRPYVSPEPVALQIFNRWGRQVFEQANYNGTWGTDAGVAPGLYYYRLSTASGQHWNGWLEVVK